MRKNFAEQETVVVAIVWKSLNPGERKQARGYGNTDQKRLMDSLNNVDRQLKEVTDNTNKNMERSNFLFCKSLVEILDDLTPEQNMDARIRMHQVLVEIKYKK